MKILIFTEGTALMFKDAKDMSRADRVKKSKIAGMQREERSRRYASDSITADYGSVHDYANYIPNGNVVSKLGKWNSQGAEILYLTSRRARKEIEDIRSVLRKYDFPDYNNLYFRNKGEDYTDIVEQIIPDIFIEDDCESLGGEAEMIYPNINPQLKEKIKSVIVKEFEGIDHLPDEINTLKSYNMDSVSSTE